MRQRLTNARLEAAIAIALAAALFAGPATAAGERSPRPLPAPESAGSAAESIASAAATSAPISPDIAVGQGAPTEAQAPAEPDVAAPPPPAGEAPDPLFDDDPLFDEAYDEDLDLDVTPDPLEGLNRKFFTFNQWLDRGLWEPVTKTYRFLVPEGGRDALHRLFRNAGSAPIFVNDLLQLRFRDAGETLGRFVLNTTVGMGGLFDAGIEAGWEFHDSDFGQTLALYGVPSGPYIVFPLFGPSTVRDGFGDVVDRAFEPLTYVFGFSIIGSTVQVAVGTGTGITTYEAYSDELDALEEHSIDFYSALRSVYLQDRAARIRYVYDRSLIDVAEE